MYSLQLNEVFSLPSKRLFKIFSCGFFFIKAINVCGKKESLLFLYISFSLFLEKKTKCVMKYEKYGKQHRKIYLNINIHEDNFI